MTWVKDTPWYANSIIWTAEDPPFNFSIAYENDSKQWRATMYGVPHQGDIVLVRCDELEEAQRFCEWTNRAYQPNTAASCAMASVSADSRSVFGASPEIARNAAD